MALTAEHTPGTGEAERPEDLGLITNCFVDAVDGQTVYASASDNVGGDESDYDFAIEAFPQNVRLRGWVVPGLNFYRRRIEVPDSEGRPKIVTEASLSTIFESDEEPAVDSPHEEERALV